MPISYEEAASTVPKVTLVLLAVAVAIAIIGCVAVHLLRRCYRQQQQQQQQQQEEEEGAKKKGVGEVFVVPFTAKATVKEMPVQPGVGEGVDFVASGAADPTELDAGDEKQLQLLTDMGEVELPEPSDDSSLGQILLKVKFNEDRHELHITAIRARQLNSQGQPVRPHCEILFCPGNVTPLCTKPCFNSIHNPVWRLHFVVKSFLPSMLHSHSFKAQVRHGTNKDRSLLLGEAQIVLAKYSLKRLLQGVVMWRNLVFLKDEDYFTHGVAHMEAAYHFGRGRLDVTILRTENLMLHERHSRPNRFVAKVSLFVNGSRHATCLTPTAEGTTLQVWNRNFSFSNLHGVGSDSLLLKVKITDVTDPENKRQVAGLALGAEVDREDCQEIWRQICRMGAMGYSFRVKLLPPSMPAGP